MQRGYGAWFPRALSRKLDKCGMDFISGLIENDVYKRFTAIEALQHPFLKDKTWIEWTVVQFIHFAKANSFKYVVAGLCRKNYEKERPRHLAEIRLFYEELAQIKSEITYEDFKGYFSKCENVSMDENMIQKIFGALSFDNNTDEIRFDHILNAFVYYWLVSSDSRLYREFLNLDKKDVGYITVKELKDKIARVNPPNVGLILKCIDAMDWNDDGIITCETWLDVW